MSIKQLTACTFAGATLLLAGCSTPKDTGAYLPVNNQTASQEMTSKFVLLDEGAQESVDCPGLQERWLPDGRLQVKANVRNRENRRIQVQINCVFKDEQGFSVGETPFQNLILAENSIETVEFTSLNDQARTYTVRVRQAR